MPSPTSARSSSTSRWRRRCCGEVAQGRRDGGDVRARTGTRDLTRRGGGDFPRPLRSRLRRQGGGAQDLAKHPSPRFSAHRTRPAAAERHGDRMARAGAVAARGLGLLDRPPPLRSFVSIALPISSRSGRPKLAHWPRAARLYLRPFSISSEQPRHEPARTIRRLVAVEIHTSTADRPRPHRGATPSPESALTDSVCDNEK